MAYISEWINRFEQFGHVDITLILTDEKGLRPDIRIDKNYHNAKIVDDKFLSAEAESEITKEIERQDGAAAEVLAEADRLRKSAEATLAQADATEAKAVEVQKQIDEVKQKEEDEKNPKDGEPVDVGGVEVIP